MEPQVRPSPQGSPQFVSKSEVIDCEDQMTNKMEQLVSQFPQRSGYPIFLPPVKVSGIGAEFLSPPTVTPAAASMLPTQLPLQHQLYSLAMQQQQQLRHPQHLLAAAAVASGSQIFPWPLHFGYNKAYPLDPRLFVAIGGANGGAGVVCRPPDEPKPQHSYIGLIAMAILSSTENKLVLSDIYRYILDNYSYFRNRGSGWRNSIRHNLSLNDCFIKAGRSPNGKGHFWAIHPANIDDFRKGDFRRRKAQRRVRKHMGLSVEEEDDDSLSSPPSPVAKLHLSASSNCLIETMCSNNEDDRNRLTETDVACSFSFRSNSPGTESYRRDNGGHRSAEMNEPKTHQKRRQFDVASLLAPDLDVQSSTLRGKTDEVTSSRSQCSESHTIAQHSSLNLQAPPPTGCQSHKEVLRCDAFKLKTSPLKITTTSLSDVVLDNSSKKLHNKKTETERLEDDCFQRKQQEFTAVERDERDEQKSPEDLCSSPPDLAARGNPRRSSLDWATLQALQSIRHRIRSVTSSFSN